MGNKLVRYIDLFAVNKIELLDRMWSSILYQCVWNLIELLKHLIPVFGERRKEIHCKNTLKDNVIPVEILKSWSCPRRGIDLQRMHSSIPYLAVEVIFKYNYHPSFPAVCFLLFGLISFAKSNMAAVTFSLIYKWFEVILHDTMTI